MTPADRPLTGVRVVDAVEGPLASATRYLAELGATVDRVVGAADDPIRDEAANAGKWRRDPGNKALIKDLLAEADIVVEDIGLDTNAILGTDPTKIIMSVSPFGRENNFATWKASNAVLHALSGELSRSGLRGRAPLLPPGQLAWECAATQAAFVALQYYYFALRTGRGGLLDFAALDGAVQALDPGFGIGGSATLGRPAHLMSRDRPAKGTNYPIFRCADGYVRLCLLSPRQWQGMFRWMGSPPAFADPSFNKTAVRYRSPELLPAIATFFSGRTREELERDSLAHGVPLSAMNSLYEPPTLQHFQERSAFRQVEVDGQSAAFPNGCIVVDGQRMTPVSAEHHVTRPSKAALNIERPYDGLKVLDLGVIVVGAETGRLLADQGADVVKIESRAFPDGNRQSHLPYGLSSGFAAGHRNKRSLGLDLRHPSGRMLFLHLVRKADVILSNFKPGTMESLGLDRKTLTAINPGIVTIESSAFGDTGSWSRRMGYGPLVRAATGLASTWRYPDNPESFSDSVTIYPDHVAARVGAIAATALLIRRERTKLGGHASVAQAEVMIAHFGPEITCAQLSRVASKETSSLYQCAGDDEWCVVTERHAGCRAAINRVTGGETISGWMSQTSANEAMEQLQEQGVAAARMLRVSDLASFGYYAQRELLRGERHPLLADDVVAEAAQAKGDLLRAPPLRSAPLAGEHSCEVLSEWLGLASTSIEQLLASGCVQLVQAEELAAAQAAVGVTSGRVVA